MIRHKKLDRPWFEQRLRERQLSQRRFASEVGIDHARISMLFNGKGSPMTIAEAQHFSDVLRQPVHEILRRAGIDVETQHSTVKIRGHIDADAVVHFLGKGTEDETDGPHDLPRDAYALQVRAHNSRFAWLDRWLVYVSGVEQPASDLYGHLALVTLKDGTQCIGEVRRGYKEGTINIHLGADVRENASAEYATAVLWLRPSNDHQHAQPSGARRQ